MDNRQVVWEDVAKQVDQLADKLGMPIDAGIKEAIIAMNANGFQTTASCEGHTDHGVAGPWIDFKSPENVENLIAEGDKLFKQADEMWKKGEQKEARPIFEQAHKLFDHARKPTLELSSKILDLITEFYSTRSVPHHQKLNLHRIGYSMRLQIIGSEVQDIKTPEEKAMNLDLYKKEMNSFADFLKNKFITSG